MQFFSRPPPPCLLPLPSPAGVTCGEYVEVPSLLARSDRRPWYLQGNVAPLPYLEADVPGCLSVIPETEFGRTPSSHQCIP